MSDAKDDPIWGGFLADWGHWIPELFITPGTLDALAGQVPSEWISAAKRPQRDTIAAIWQTASRSLPRFSGYLANEILSVAVGKGDIGYVLIYFLQKCMERPVGVYHPGFIFGGLPTAETLLDELEHKQGKLPSSLADLWRVHDFMLTKEEGVVSSLDAAVQLFAGAPRRLPEPLQAPEDRDLLYECLAVVDSERPSSLCLRRRPGTNVWEDHLVRAFAHQATYLPAAWATIDDMLTDWERSDYRPTP